MNLILSSLLVAGLAYGYAVLYTLVRARRHLFRPPETGYRDGGGLIRIPGYDGLPLAAIYRKQPGPSVTVLLLHGNAEDLSDLVPQIDEFSRRGYSVLAYDYRGFGLSGGKPDERALFADALAVFDHAVSTFGLTPGSVLVFGRSLGGSLATHLAASRPVGWLVLEGAFLSAFRVATRFRLLPLDPFRNTDRIRQVRCPLLIVHGTEDPIVPVWHARALYRLAAEPKELLLIEGRVHVDLHLADEEVVFAALERLTGRKRGE